VQQEEKLVVLLELMVEMVILLVLEVDSKELKEW
jgi:hypothetical protein